MKRWAILLCGLAAFAAILLAAYFALAHHMYTVGIDVNLKAVGVAGAGLVVAGVLVTATLRLVHRKRG